eukprot:4007564-Amphidinium_carterae.1
MVLLPVPLLRGTTTCCWWCPSAGAAATVGFVFPVDADAILAHRYLLCVPAHLRIRIFEHAPKLWSALHAEARRKARHTVKGRDTLARRASMASCVEQAHIQSCHCMLAGWKVAQGCDCAPVTRGCLAKKGCAEKAKSYGKRKGATC